MSSFISPSVRSNIVPGAATPPVAAPFLRSLCEVHGYEYERIIGKLRKPKFVAQRRKLARELRAVGWSFPRIGRAMNRDHSTIIHLLRGE